MGAPYRQIVDEIRGRIASGRLKPGDRVPSARQITQQWGVAIATATKVLAALTAEGLARPVVGVGTVVTDVSPQETLPPSSVEGRRVRTPDGELTQDRIVRAAITIADAEGLPAVTMRRLGVELDVAAMSLYRHIASKEELVTLMSDAIFAEATLPEPPPAGWRAQLETVARVQWSLTRQHAWLASVMSLSRPMLVPHGMAYTEWSMRAVHEAGFDLEESIRVAVALVAFVLGLASSVQMEVEAQRDTGITDEEWMQSQEEAFGGIMASGRFPLLMGLAAQPDFDLDLDSIFEMGLALFLDGFAQRVARL